MEGERRQEGAHRLVLERLVDPRPRGLHLEAKLVHALRVLGELGQMSGLALRRRVHAVDDGRLGRLVALVEAAPRGRVGLGEAPETANGVLHVPADRHAVAVGRHQRPVGVGGDQLQTVLSDLEVLHRRRQLGDEETAGMDVR